MNVMEIWNSRLITLGKKALPPHKKEAAGINPAPLGYQSGHLGHQESVPTITTAVDHTVLLLNHTVKDEKVVAE